jgi:alpha-1,2-mannosyltransferase
VSLRQAIERSTAPDGAEQSGVSRRLGVWALASQHALFAVVPVLFTLYMCAYSVGHHAFAIDFHNAFWPAGRRVLEGLTPYAGPRSAAVTSGVAFVYPAFGALLFAGLAWIPQSAADVLFTVASLAAALAALRLLGVRDWRLYGLVALWPPVVSGWQTANVSLLLVLGVAAAWRLRDRPLATGAVVALVVSLKVFLWPLSLWLLATRRYTALSWALAVGLAINAIAWAVLGIDQLHAYVELARAVTKVEEATAYTLLALALHLGFGRLAAYAISLAIAAGAAALCLRAGRRDRESTALLLAIAVSLLATPTVWRHYFALLLVPLAIARPQLSAVWILPVAMYLCPVTSPALWQLCLALGVLALVVAILLRHPTPIATSWADKLGMRSRLGARFAL